MDINENKTVSILGSTGSVGTQALDVVRSQNMKVYGLSGSSSVELIEKQIREFKPSVCAMLKEDAAKDLRTRVADTDCRIESGESAICDIASSDKNDFVLNSISGIAGLKPSLSAISASNTLALANKETIVTAGSLIERELKKNNCEILPVDSEHSAIFQCLKDNKREEVERILLTASGGPFFGKDRSFLESVTPELALAHPTWKMGPKITVDSASLMNKGFEVIEAVHLFHVPSSMVEVIIHPESIIHSMVEYKDKSTIALLSNPDMRLCIQYAFTYPNHLSLKLDKLDLVKLGSLTFNSPDYSTFKLLKLAYDIADNDGTLGATLNGANEKAVELFLNKKISFTDIFDYVDEVVRDTENMPLTIDNVFEADKLARIRIEELTERKR